MLIELPARQVDSVAVSPDDSTMAVGDSQGNGTWLWDATTGKQTASLSIETTTGAAFSPDGKTLAVGDTTSHVDLVNVASRKVTATVTDPSAGSGVLPTATAFSPDGRTVAFLDQNSQVYLWNITSHNAGKPMTDPGGNDPLAQPNEIKFSPNGALLAAGDANTGKVYIWDVATRSLVATLSPAPSNGGFISTQSAYWFAFSPDGKTLAVADGLAQIRLWNIASRAYTATVDDGSGQAGSGYGGVDLVSFSPDGKTLAIVYSATSGSGTRTSVGLWSIASQKYVATLDDQADILALAFTPDGKTLVTTDDANRIKLWNAAGSS